MLTKEKTTVAEVRRAFPSLQEMTYLNVATHGLTPQPVLDKLSNAIRAAVHKPEIREKLRGLGAVVVGSTAAEYREWLKGDRQRWTQLVTTAHIKAD